jgi:transposase
MLNDFSMKQKKTLNAKNASIGVIYAEVVKVLNRSRKDRVFNWDDNFGKAAKRLELVSAQIKNLKDKEQNISERFLDSNANQYLQIRNELKDLKTMIRATCELG